MEGMQFAKFTVYLRIADDQLSSLATWDDSLSRIEPISARTA